MFASALLVPFAAVIAVQMKRIEGPRPVLSYIQLVSAGLLSLEFIIPLMVFQTAAYRLDVESARLIQMLNDMGWLMFVGVISSAVVMIASIGLAILIDRRERPVFPRWAGYFNLWVALLISPAGIIVFFKHGPFAWNGLFGFFVPLAAFAAWITVMVVILLRAIDQDVADGAGDPAPADYLGDRSCLTSGRLFEIVTDRSIFGTSLPEPVQRRGRLLGRAGDGEPGARRR